MMQTPITWIEVSKSAFDHNIHMYKRILGPDKALAAVIKSNAYGHGMLPIAKLCQENPNVDWVCVATLTEAMTIRKNGFTKPILVVYFVDADPREAIAHDVDLMVSDMKTVHELNECGIAASKPISVHLKIDSGMSRFGLLPEDVFAAVQQIVKMPGIVLKGIYSHLAQSANEDQTFSVQQEAAFKGVLDDLSRNKIDIPYKHLANTAGTTALSMQSYNLARVGLGIYGWWPSQSNKDLTQKQYPWFSLKPVLTLKARIHVVRDVKENQFVGYDRTYKTTRPTRVAVLPIGYYDGYDRRLSSKGITLVRDQYAPVIGIIAMTSTLIDVTDISHVQENDEVILMGNYDKVTPTQLANVIGSFNAREIMTRLNPDILRIVVT